MIQVNPLTVSIEYLC